MQTILQPITNVLYAILEFFHANLGFSWGWSIVCLTIIVRIVLIPLTYKQIKSMRAMQVLQPKIKELQEKYKDNRELLNQKLMEFYRENKFNPMGSCLPLLLQMPVFFALFYMLRGQEFPGDNHWLWIGAFPDAPSWLQLADNITQFDLPLILLYAASQFLSSAMMAGKDQTQRMLMYVMPIGIGIITYIGKWPAGLLIYWFTSNLWTIGQQYLIMRLVKAPEPAPSAPAKTGGKTGGKSAGDKAGGKTGKAPVPAPSTSGGKAAGDRTGKAPAKTGKAKGSKS